MVFVVRELVFETMWDSRHEFRGRGELEEMGPSDGGTLWRHCGYFQSRHGAVEFDVDGKSRGISRRGNENPLRAFGWESEQFGQGVALSQSQMDAACAPLAAELNRPGIN